MNDQATQDEVTSALYETVHPEDTFADVIRDHLYQSHGINARAGTSDAAVIASHVADHVAHASGITPIGGWPNGWDDHEPDEFYIGRWVRRVESDHD